MRFTIISADIGHRTSGQSRFAVNLARGLRSAGSEVTVVAAQILPNACSTLAEAGVRTRTLGEVTTTTLAKARLMSRFSRVGEELAELAKQETRTDWFVALSDSAVSASVALGRENSIYISNGDLALMFLSPSFYATSGAGRWLLSRDAASIILRNAKHAAEFRLRLANSEFCRNFMSYLYNLPFQGVIYPPVDTDAFKSTGEPRQASVVALARNRNEPGFPLLEKLAKVANLTVIGGAKIGGARNLGEVEDSVLIHELSRAYVTACPGISEFFGYLAAESLACGTPVVAFDACGPAELVKRGNAGWLAAGDSEFLSLVHSAALTPPSPELQSAARESAAELSLRASADRLMYLVARAGSNKG